MRRLMLLRHAKTENDAPAAAIRTAGSTTVAAAMPPRSAAGSAGIRPFPICVLVSPAVRAHQTWEIAWEAMKDLVPEPQVELLPELYGADSAQLLQTIRSASAADPQRLMLVGHNPGMHELALALTGSGDAAGRKALADNLPTSGLAVFDFAIDDWADVAFRRGRLVLFVSPKLLKQASDD